MLQNMWLPLRGQLIKDWTVYLGHADSILPFLVNILYVNFYLSKFNPFLDDIFVKTYLPDMMTDGRNKNTG